MFDIKLSGLNILTFVDQLSNMLGHPLDQNTCTGNSVPGRRVVQFDSKVLSLIINGDHRPITFTQGGR